MLTLILGHLAGSPAALAQQAARLHVLGRFAQQLGRLIGSIEGWAAAEAWMDPPALVEVAAWRKHHQIKASGRDEYKREAIAKARQLGLGHFLDPYPGAKAVNGGQQADVAEAMLEGLYAVRFYGMWPSRPTSQQLAVDVARVTR